MLRNNSRDRRCPAVRWTLCSALLIVKVIFVITVFFLFLLCVSTILVNKDDHNTSVLSVYLSVCPSVRRFICLTAVILAHANEY